MRSNAQWTNSPLALKLDPVELRLRCYSERDQHERIRYTSKRLGECHRQGAAAFGWDKRNPRPRSMRDGSELVGWGMATGVWEALQVESAVRIVLTANGHAEIASAFSESALARTRSWRRSPPICWACRSTTSRSTRQLDATAGSGRRWLMDRCIGIACHRQDRRRGAERAIACGQDDAGFPACRREGG